jgi:hypothetical protein
MVETNWEGRGLRLAVGEVSAGKHEPRVGEKSRSKTKAVRLENDPPVWRPAYFEDGRIRSDHIISI